uniref:DUF424 family protein n=1 Tax=Ignisphaera aggregans TaxID=334771 RepID=A0A7C4NQR0_9CREN
MYILESNFYLKIHQYQGYLIVAVCDEEILGKVFKESDVILNVSPNFYKGEIVGFEKALEAIKSADIAVITGKRIVEKLAEIGLISKDFALKVGDQLHVQIVREVLSIDKILR